MIFAVLLLWYASGWAGIGLLRRDWCNSFPEDGYFCASPAQYLGCALGAFGGLAFFFIGLLIFLLGAVKNTKAANWFVRPICPNKTKQKASGYAEPAA
jgi:hypothetical protein